MILSMTLDQKEPSAIKALWPDALITDLSSGTARALCADGAILNLWRITAGALPDLIRSGDLTSRASMMRDRSDWCYLVIQGILQPEPGGWSWASTQGALLSLQELGIQIANIDSPAQSYCALVETLSGRDRGIKRMRPPRAGWHFQAGADMLLSLPGIGEATALKLIEYSGSPARALWALCDLTITIPGVPAKVQTSARAALELLDHEQFAIILQEETISHV